ncbi:hypothetical protein Q8F55_007124 [Vanrija albida]|uniref:C2H2-type domain-containing protein n=1 Tax=Vanrija albida TaxID=181172 RepID=A0ABR3PZ06_9TREE
MSALARLNPTPVRGPPPPPSAAAAGTSRGNQRTDTPPSSRGSSSSASSAAKGKSRASEPGDSAGTSAASSPIPEARNGAGKVLSLEHALVEARSRFLGQPLQCPLKINGVECDAELASIDNLARHVQVHFENLKRRPPKLKYSGAWIDRSCSKTEAYPRLSMHFNKSHKSALSDDMLRRPTAPFKPELPELPPLPATVPSYLVSCPPARPNRGGTNTPRWNKTKYPVHEEYPKEYHMLPDPSVLRHSNRKLLSSDIFPSRSDIDDEPADVSVMSTPMKMGSIPPQRTPSHRPKTPVPSANYYRRLPPLPNAPGRPLTTVSGRPLRLAAIPEPILPADAKARPWRIGHEDEELPVPSLSRKGKAPLRLHPVDERTEVRLVQVPEDFFREARVANEAAMVVAKGREAAAAASAGVIAASESTPVDSAAADSNGKGKRKLATEAAEAADVAAAKQPKRNVEVEDIELAAEKFAFDKTGRLFGIDFAKHKDAFISMHYHTAKAKRNGV